MDTPAPSSPFRRFIPIELASPEGWKSGLTIYAKALAIFAAAVLVLFGVLFGLTESVILSQFESIERAQVDREMERIRELVEFERQSLASTVGDWAYWDDMHAFFQNPDADFLETNINPMAVQNLGLDFISLWNLQKRCIAVGTGKGIAWGDDSQVLAVDFEESGFFESLQRPGIHTALVLQGNRVLVVAGAAVLDSMRIARPTGYLVMGKYLGDTRLQTWRSSSEGSIRIESLARLLASQQLKTEVIALLATGKPQIATIDPENVVGLSLLRDANDRAIAVLVLQQKRALYQAGVRAARIFLLAMTAAGGGLVLVLWFVIDWNLLRRISRIDGGVKTMAITGKFPEAAELRSHDELGRLSRSIISMSNSLQDAEQNYRRLFESSHDGTVVLSLPGLTILEANPAFSRYVETPIRELLGRRIDAAIPVFPVDDLLLSAQAGELFYRTELFLRREPGQNLCAEIVGARFEAPTGPRIQVSLRDVTDRREAEEKLRELSGRLLSLQDEERRRIARELHDSTAQNLSALEMNLVLLQRQISPKEDKALRIVAESRSIADSASREIRTLSYLLHPPLLDEVGLLFAIRWFVEGYVTRTGIQIDLNLPSDVSRFAPEIETTIFRIIQEALTNIYRHAESTSGWIFLSCDKREIVLQVGDSGRGFEIVESPSRSGLGLAGMKERVRQHRGEFLIESSKRGTVISVQIPLGGVLSYAEKRVQN